MRSIKMIHGYLVLLISLLFLFTGCGQDRVEAFLKGEDVNQNPFKVKLAVFGELYEAPLYAAVEKGFFKKEGIDVQLIKVDFNTFKNNFSKGLYDGATCDYRIFKAIEEGLDIKLVAGLHGSCMQILAEKNSFIRDIRNLKNKVIGVEALGNAPMTMTSQLLERNGIDPKRKITWKVYPQDRLEAALLSKAVDAISIFETGEKEPKNIKDSLKLVYSSSGSSSKGHSHSSFQHFYSSFAGISGRLVLEEPKKSAYMARAWIKAAKWVSENPKEAVKIMVEKKYVGGNLESNTTLFQYYMWSPGVRYAKKNMESYIKQQKILEILGSHVDEKDFLERVYGSILPELSG
ncbi:MAG: ABC transporter substrate-binding protein [Clostridia bacterium]|nr:ABC transporter substrate-binding protein [Clostridia bacterium]